MFAHGDITTPLVYRLAFELFHGDLREFSGPFPTIGGDGAYSALSKEDKEMSDESEARVAKGMVTGGLGLTAIGLGAGVANADPPYDPPVPNPPPVPAPPVAPRSISRTRPTWWFRIRLTWWFRT